MVDKSKGTVKPLPQANSGSTQYTSQYSGYGYANPGGYTPGIVTGGPSDWFGPLNPQAPSAPPEVAGRQFDFPSGYNLNIQPRAYEPIKFSDLRALAENYDVLRIIIETRKDQMCRLRWNIKPRENAYGKKLTAPDDPVLTEIRDFFTMPDGEQFWDAWLREILEDLFVIDAPTLFTRRSRGGKLLGLDPIDGSTVKRVIDNHGRTPQAPLIAYQQDLHGLPAVNYTTSDLIYRPRNVRSHKVYGYSPVEQVVMTINIAMRRQIFLLQYYTEGNVPEALIGAPEGWSVNQIKEFQTWFDSVLAGETGARRRARFIPGGMGKNIFNTKEGALTDITDEWLTRICCFAFSIAPTPFIKQINRATAESQKDQATEEGLAPIQMWVKSLIDYIIWKEWKRRDIEFGWEIPDDINAKDQADVLNGYVKTGVFSINMALDRLGEDPIEGGDQHLALLPTGWVPIAPTNQFGASGGANGPGQVNPDVQGKGNVKPRTGKDPVDTAPPKEPGGPDPKIKPIKEVSKAAVIPFGIGLSKVSIKLLSAPTDRETMVHARQGMEKVLTKTLAKMGKQAHTQIVGALRVLNKSSLFDQPAARMVAQTVDLTGFRDTPAEIVGYIRDVTTDAAEYITSGYGADNVAVAGQVNDWSVTRSASLVGLEYDNMGMLIPDISLDMSIDLSTVNMIERQIAAGMIEGLTGTQVADGIEATVFGADRAVLITNAELLRANSAGMQIGAEALGSIGMVAKKSWQTSGDSKVCQGICAENELDGFITMDSSFSSGDQFTPGHPRCRCQTIIQVA